MASHKRWPVVVQGTNFATFQWMRHMAIPWALPIYWEWFLLHVEGNGTRLVPRLKGWTAPLTWFDGHSTYQNLKLDENLNFEWRFQWTSKVIGVFGTNTLIDIRPAFGTPAFGEFRVPTFVEETGRTSPPLWVNHFDFALWDFDTGPQDAVIWRMIPHSECWVPDFPQ